MEQGWADVVMTEPKQEGEDHTFELCVEGLERDVSDGLEGPAP